MERYLELLVKLLAQETVQIAFPNRNTDTECYQKIEEIIRMFESLGNDGGNRYGFG